MESYTAAQQRRQYFILRVLLLGSIALSCIALVILFVDFFAARQMHSGRNLIIGLLTFSFFLILYSLAVRRLTALAAFLFCVLYELISIFLVVAHGIQLPQAILLFGLTVVMASLLIGTVASLLFTVFTAISLIGIVYLTHHNILHPNIDWSTKQGTFGDAITFSLTYTLFLITTWLSNREIERSFRGAQQAQASLTQERDQLEQTVAKRTRQLRERQQAEIDQLYELAYFGRVTAGVLHDLVTPLTTVSLSLKRLNTNDSSILIKRAMASAHRIEQYVVNARAQLKKQQHISLFSLDTEIRQAADALKPRYEERNISLTLDLEESVMLSGDPIKFFRLIANLLGNAIEACTDGRDNEGGQRISVILSKNFSQYMLTIEDTGQGIRKDDLRHIFDPFFTTKLTSQNSGIGLSISKEIVEQSFGGTISIESTQGKGAKVILVLPESNGTT